MIENKKRRPDGFFAHGQGDRRNRPGFANDRGDRRGAGGFSGDRDGKRRRIEEEPVAHSPSQLDLTKRGIYMIPLSGVREFGPNATLYYAMGYWILIDLGIGFKGEEVDGINVVLPRLDFLKNIPREKFLGIFITHAHEDHVGGTPIKIQQIEHAMRNQTKEGETEAEREEARNWKVPVYASPFTISILEEKLKDRGIKEPQALHAVREEVIKVGPFEIEWVRVTHSIPDNFMLAVEAQIDEDGSKATVLHTGDWRFDPSPVIGQASDMDKLKELQKKDVLATVCDSTHAMTEGTFRSEKDVKDSLKEIVSGIKQGRVVIVCFSTNVQRIYSSGQIGEETGRRVALLGRSLNRIQRIASEHGFLKDLPPFLSEDEAVIHDKNKLLLVSVGSQGEPQSGLRRLAEETHPKITLEEGDTVIMSARMITGKEKDVDEMLNRFAERGINVITTKHDADIHVSGHPPREDLIKLYELVKPKAVVPVHGTAIAMKAQEELANSMGIKSMFVKAGDVVFLGPTRDERVLKTPSGTFVKTSDLKDILTVDAKVKVGKLGLDGKVLVPLDGSIVKERAALKFGCVVVSVMVKPDGNFTKEVILQGVCEKYEENFRRELGHAIDFIISNLSSDARKSFTTLSGAIRHGVRTYIYKKRSTDPQVIILAHMPRGMIVINTKQSESGQCASTMTSDYCEESMVKVAQNALKEIDRQLTGKRLKSDKMMQKIKDDLEKAFRSKNFDPNLTPVLIVNIKQEEGNS